MKAYEKTIAALIARLKELPDGTEITTCQLMKAAGVWHDDMDFSDLMLIHSALFEAAEKEHITLDMSKHENMLEGLPYNLDFTVMRQNPNLRLTGKTASGEALFEMEIDAEAQDDILGFNLRHLFMGSVKNADGEPLKYVVVELVE